MSHVGTTDTVHIPNNPFSSMLSSNVLWIKLQIFCIHQNKHFFQGLEWITKPDIIMQLQIFVKEEARMQ